MPVSPCHKEVPTAYSLPSTAGTSCISLNIQLPLESNTAECRIDSTDCFVNTETSTCSLQLGMFFAKPVSSVDCMVRLAAVSSVDCMVRLAAVSSVDCMVRLAAVSSVDCMVRLAAVSSVDCMVRLAAVSSVTAWQRRTDSLALQSGADRLPIPCEEAEVPNAHT